MSPKVIFFALSRVQILEFLGLAKSTKIAKDQLIEQLLQRIEADAQEKARLLETFLYELAVEPSEVEELLQCTQVERKRWVKEGKLPVLEYRSFRKSGRDLEYAVHDRREILKISQDDIQQWREAYQIEVQVHRRAGVLAAVERRKANQQIRLHFLLSWQQTIDEWKQKGSVELVLVLVLAYWTLWASRLAKENHVKALNGKKYAALYAACRDAWYERKNQAMLLLAQTPYARLSFYRPPDPDKVGRQKVGKKWAWRKFHSIISLFNSLSEETTGLSPAPGPQKGRQRSRNSEPCWHYREHESSYNTLFIDRRS